MTRSMDFSRSHALRCLALCALLALPLGCGSDGDGKADTSGGADAADTTAGLDAGLDASADSTEADSSSDVEQDTGGGGKTLLTARSLRFDVDFLAVWGTASNDVWWVGRQGVILHDNGKVLAPRDSGTDRDLYAVWGTGKDDVYFAGDRVLLRWNGKKIIDLTPDDLGEVILRTIHVPADGSTVLVAGDEGNIFRLHKGAFVRETTNSGLRLRGLRALSAGSVWAVGDAGQGLRLSGGTWQAFSMPSASDTVFAIANSKAGRLFAVGTGGYIANTVDKTWQATLSNDPKSRDLYTVWARDDNAAFALGKDGALVELKGSKWGVRDIDGTYMKTRTFRGAWGANDSAGTAVGYAVGDEGAGLRYDGATDKWNDYRAETATHLLAVRKLADGRLVAVGGGGLLLTAKDATAPFVDLGVDVTGVDLEDACDDGDGGVVAVGDAGLVVHVDKSGTASISKPDAASGLKLRGVVRAGTTLIAVGTGGVVIRKGSAGWESENSGVQFDLHAITAVGDVAYAVGAFGTILRRDANGSWAKESSGGTTPLHRVVGFGEKEAVAVGDNGIILSRNAAGTWSKEFEQPGLFLFGVDRYADGRIIAVGWQGSLVVGKPGSFKALDSGIPNVLRAVATDGGKAVAVGHKGGVYQVGEGL
ncbi:MAG: hypothetical protein H6747_13255 [Deltaproteobacteria bacterium]|nr:hypothetical protein [Deltaproteobacteria bacterium]